jgi:hypothetical protein
MPVVNPNAANTLNAAYTPESVIGFQPLSQSTSLLQNGIPFVTPASGTISATGALSGMGVALPTTYANAYFFFPANALSTSSAAGFYFTQMTSTTAGTVFLNAYTSGIPAIPVASARVSVTAGQGAYTQISSTTTSISITIPANTMGPNGKLRINLQQSNNNSAGQKSSVIQFGGSNSFNLGQTTNLGMWISREITNQGVTNVQSQTALTAAGPIATSTAPLYFAVDTTAAVTLNFRFALNTPATDAMTLESCSVEVIAA